MSPRRIAVTDSGFGGLALVAHLERAGASVEIIYVNACPSDALGYNQMTSVARKAAVFAGVLAAIDRLEADAIVVACNTLSALLPRLPPASGPPIRAIVDVGADLVADALRDDPGGWALALATVTTALARPWGPRLAARAIDPARLLARACPGLETMISNDPTGARVGPALAAIAAEPRGPGLRALLLGCTHYSLRAPLFAAAFRAPERGIAVLDPVLALGEQLVRDGIAGAGGRPPAIRFLTRYRPPDREVATIAGLLAAAGAPRSAQAVVDFEVDPELFPLADA